jgi:glycosyltransferase involved in cell wall biosynthesis
MAPVVSIILPTFNRLNLLGPAIHSIFAQTFTDWELLIADDGSDDETKTWLRSFGSSPRVKYVWLTHTGRPGVVRNAALREARGAYIAFQDSDDVWLPEKLDQQIGSLRRNGQRGWGITKFVLVDEFGSPTAWERRTGGWPAPQGWILEKLVRGEVVIALPSVVVSRRLLEQVGGFDEELIGAEDYDLFLRLSAHSEVDAVDQPLTLVRRHTQHFSGQGVIEFESNRRVIEKVLRWPSVEHLRPVLCQQRAQMIAGLAKSHAAAGQRGRALMTICSSIQHGWRYPHWWVGVLQALVRALAPLYVHKWAHAYRKRRRACQ